MTAGDLTVGLCVGVWSRDRYRFCRGIEIWNAPCVQRNHISIQETRAEGVWRPEPNASRLAAACPARDFGDPWDFLLNAVGGREV
jgi:hypothetical protein